MKVALLSTCALSTPPRKYGGTELMVAELADGLTRLGHDVTVFATADSHPGCALKATTERPVWPPNELAELRHATLAWREIVSSPEPFDVVHLNHAAGLPFTQLFDVPAVLTIHHQREDALVEHYQAHARVSYVAISARQAALLPELKVRSVVHHGLRVEQYEAGDGRGGYVAFLGRFAPEKAPHLACDAAECAGVPLRVGGSYHAQARAYYEQIFAPRVGAARAVKLCGELDHEAKLDLLKGARALLFPIQWDEPFGLVMIESMLVGTPVIAMRRGSAPEVVEEGVTGFLVDDVNEMAERIRQLKGFDRRRCRARALQRWSNTRMAAEYSALFEALVAEQQASRPALSDAAQ